MTRMLRSDSGAFTGVGQPRRLAALFASLALCAATSLAAPSTGRAETDINAIMGGETSVDGSQAGTPGIRQQTFPGAPKDAAPSQNGLAPATPLARGSEERWVTSDHPVENLAVISVHPLPGEKCQDVLFDIRPSTRVRHSPTIGGTVDFDLGQLCLLGLRNESDRRTVVIRVGEELKTVAIVSDSRLNSGIALGPGREILTPIRPLDIKALTISVEAVWDDQIDAANPTVESFGLRLVKRTPGS